MEGDALDRSIQRLPDLPQAKTDGLRALWIYTLERPQISQDWLVYTHLNGLLEPVLLRNTVRTVYCNGYPIFRTHHAYEHLSEQHWARDVKTVKGISIAWQSYIVWLLEGLRECPIKSLLTRFIEPKQSDAFDCEKDVLSRNQHRQIT